MFQENVHYIFEKIYTGFENLCVIQNKRFYTNQQMDVTFEKMLTHFKIMFETFKKMPVHIL